MFRKRFKQIFVDNMKKIGFYKYVCDFSGDYDAIVIDDILDIHQYSLDIYQYLMKNHNMKLCLDLLKMFIFAIGLIGLNSIPLSVANATPLKCVSMSD